MEGFTPQMLIGKWVWVNYQVRKTLIGKWMQILGIDKNGLLIGALDTYCDQLKRYPGTQVVFDFDMISRVWNTDAMLKQG